MFTWECPTCGKELDVGTTECPDCSAKQPGAKSAPAQASAAAAEPPAKAEAAPKPSATLPAAAKQSREKAAAKKPRERRGMTLQPAHLAIIGLVLVMAIALAVYFARPSLFGGSKGLDLLDIPDASDSFSRGTASLGNLQVAGIRTIYDEEYKPKVRALVINHGDAAVPRVDLRVELRAPQAGPVATPLASFVIDLADGLQPHESREIETELEALGTLASLPPWDEVRIDLRDLREGASAGQNGEQPPASQ